MCNQGRHPCACSMKMFDFKKKRKPIFRIKERLQKCIGAIIGASLAIGIMVCACVALLFLPLFVLIYPDSFKL